MMWFKLNKSSFNMSEGQTVLFDHWTSQSSYLLNLLHTTFHISLHGFRKAKPFMHPLFLGCENSTFTSPVSWPLPGHGQISEVNQPSGTSALRMNVERPYLGCLIRDQSLQDVKMSRYGPKWRFRNINRKEQIFTSKFKHWYSYYVMFTSNILWQMMYSINEVQREWLRKWSALPINKCDQVFSICRI